MSLRQLQTLIGLMFLFGQAIPVAAMSPNGGNEAAETTARFQVPQALDDVFEPGTTGVDTPHGITIFQYSSLVFSMCEIV